MPPREVFLSHYSLDKDFVDSIAETLGNHEIPVWYSRTNILGAQQWQDEIGQAFRRCDWLISPKSVQSKWVKRELAFALNDDKYDNKIIPVLYEPCDFDNLSWTLSLFEIIDFSGDLNTGFGELLRTWGIGYRNQ